MMILAGKLLFVFIFSIATTTLAQPRQDPFPSCEYAANYTANNTYQRNLNTALSGLLATNNGFGFFNLSTGQGNDTVHSVALCRGDVHPDVCLDCLKDVIIKLPPPCRYQMEAVGYHDQCLLRYSNVNILGNGTITSSGYMANSKYTIDVDRFNGALFRLLYRLRDDASSGNSLLKFSTGTAEGPDSTIYAHVQCTPDLSTLQCVDCLEYAFKQIRNELYGKVGGRILVPICNFRYETYLYFNPSLQSSPPIRQPSASPAQRRQGPFPSCEYAANYTANNTYQRNLNTALSGLLATNNGFGFFNLSTGQGNDTVHSVALCRGDVHPDVCLDCLKDVIIKLPPPCRYQMEAVGYHDQCLLRYSNVNILRNGTITSSGYMANSKYTIDVDRFNGALFRLLYRLRDDASSGNSLLKFSTGTAEGPDSTIYAHVQCTPDLSTLQCVNCLEYAFKQIRNELYGKVGGRILVPICNFRYEKYLYFNKSLQSSPPILQPSASPGGSGASGSSASGIKQEGEDPKAKGKKNNTARTMIIIITVVIVSITLLCIIIRWKKKRKQMKPPRANIEDTTMDISISESLQYDFNIVKVATNDFSEENKLGRGGFGMVYKGTLGDEQQVAIKRLARDSEQGEQEFKNEVLLVAKLQHRNLVRLLGFSIEGSERILIYEFMQNASLDQFLFDATKRTVLDWEKRYNIIKGITKGLLYLHEDSRLRIVHRDLKASNILLDGQMKPKIADFGLARLFKSEDTEGDTNRIVGTFGYMAPEYAMHGQFSIKSDVFSYGILVLEIVTGQKNQYFKNGDNREDLLSFAWTSWKNGTTSDIIDATLKTGPTSLCDIIRIIHIGLLCVQEKVIDRPTMASVAQMLNNSSIVLPVPAEPAFFMGYNIDPEMPLLLEYNSLTGSGGLGSSQYSINEVSFTQDVPR